MLQKKIKLVLNPNGHSQALSYPRLTKLFYFSFKVRFTPRKMFGTARVKLSRVPKKSSAKFDYTSPFLPYQKYRAKIFGPG